MILQRKVWYLSYQGYDQSNGYQWCTVLFTQIGESRSLEWGGGDWLDRERVRDIILADNDVAVGNH